MRCLGVEHRDGERALADVEAELDPPRAGQPLGRQPRADARLPRGRVGRRAPAIAIVLTRPTPGGGGGDPPAHELGGADPMRMLFRSPAALAPPHPLERVAAAGVRRLRELRRRHRRRLAPRLRPAGLIADADEQRRHVLAVLPALGVGGARALRLDPVRRQLDVDRVRLRVGGADGAARGHVVDGDVLDDAAAEILQAAEESSSAEQPAEAAVAQGGEGVGDLGHVSRWVLGWRCLGGRARVCVNSLVVAVAERSRASRRKTGGWPPRRSSDEERQEDDRHRRAAFSRGRASLDRRDP